MKQKNKDISLLTADICARIPYGVMLSYDGEYGQEPEPFPLIDCNGVTVNSMYEVGGIKLYLRPMSSMTEEEKKELSINYRWNICCGEIRIHYHSEGYWDDDTECQTNEFLELIDWLNSHHFDYRGLIEKGLALEAPEGMYGKV